MRVVAVSAWTGFGYSMVLFLAGLQDINEDLKEAAKIDGATDLGVIRFITIPLLRPVIALVSTLTLIGGLKVFEIIYVMTNGGPNHATESVSIAALLRSLSLQPHGHRQRHCRVPANRHGSHIDRAASADGKRGPRMSISSQAGVRAAIASCP